MDTLHSANTLNTDFKAEVVAAGLIDAGQDKDQILIVRGNGQRRHVAKDIHRIDYSYFQQNLMEYLQIVTNRAGMYDSLPEGLFHGSERSDKRKSLEEVLERMRRSTEEEFFARRFFQPFEMALDQLLVEAQHYERNFDKPNFHGHLQQIFSAHWSLLELMSMEQVVFFLRMLPELYRISSSLTLLGEVLSLLHNLPVEVKLGAVSRVDMKPSKLVPLSKWKLGVRAVLSGAQCGPRYMMVNMGPTTPERAKEFVSNIKEGVLLRKLLHLMLPVNSPYKIKCSVHPEMATFKLSSPTHKTYLGINTRIK